MGEASSGDGYAVSSLDEIGEGYGFRKIRRALGVTAFGINAIVLPPGFDTGVHYHDQQEETAQSTCWDRVGSSASTPIPIAECGTSARRQR